MYKQYFKQALLQIKQYKISSIVTIIGTGMAIFLIMVVVMMQQVDVVPFSPENNRDRFLHVKYMSFKDIKNDASSSNGPMSIFVVNQCFKSLKTPEAVTAYCRAPYEESVSLPKMVSQNFNVKITDDAFWKVFDFSFISGKPFDKSQFDAGLHVTVLTETTAKKIFNSMNVVGKELLIDKVPFKVVGVVKDVSTLATNSYSELWIPYTVFLDKINREILQGSLSVTILAHSRDDFDKIRKEIDRRENIFNKSLASSGMEILKRNRPYDQEKNSLAVVANEEPDMESYHREQLIIFIILLIVPAVNLSSMTQSRLRQRVVEIGVRRAFGGTRKEIINQIMIENMVITLLAGIIGLALSFLFALTAQDLLFVKAMSFTDVMPDVHLSMLMHYSTFLYALLFCFILNVLSSGIPAYRASRINIVNSLMGKII